MSLAARAAVEAPVFVGSAAAW
jgi:PIN domain nuclease of toxin-antitoxin system